MPVVAAKRESKPVLVSGLPLSKEDQQKLKGLDESEREAVVKVLKAIIEEPAKVYRVLSYAESEKALPKARAETDEDARIVTHFTSENFAGVRKLWLGSFMKVQCGVPAKWLQKADTVDKEVVRKLVEFCTGVAKSTKLPEGAQPTSVLTRVLSVLVGKFGRKLDQALCTRMTNEEGLVKWQEFGVYGWKVSGGKATHCTHMTTGISVNVPGAYSLNTGEMRTIHQNWSDKEAYIAIGKEKVKLRKWFEDRRIPQIEIGNSINKQVQEITAKIVDEDAGKEKELKRQLVRNDSELAKDFEENDKKRRKKGPPPASALPSAVPLDG